MMTYFLLGLLAFSVLCNIATIMFMVRFREAHDNTSLAVAQRIDRLTKELLQRLPNRPYGVQTQDREPELTIGPIDARIND